MAALKEPVRKQLHEQKLGRLSEAARTAQRTPPAQRSAAQSDLVLETAPLLKIADKEILDAMNDANRARYQQLLSELKSFERFQPPSPPVTMALASSPGAAPKTHLLERGELSNPGTEVLPGFPRVLDRNYQPEDAVKAGGPAADRRTTLARWLTRSDHPLTARVLVNRLWQHHIGVGLVPTPNDFGQRGSPPRNAALLDWLATEFVSPTSSAPDRVRGAWSLKRMHKLIALSAAYQQSTYASRETLQKDPDNVLFSRMNRQRLEGEIIRDSLLAISGQLNLRMGGRGVFPPLPPEATRGSLTPWVVSKDPDDYRRRSIYIFARRNLRFPFLETFDLPDSNQSCPRRERSVTAPQALALLNSNDTVRAALATADRLQQETSNPDERIRLAYRLILGRSPTAREVVLARDFLSQSPLSEWCRALFNVNEFVFVD
jgi:hypothetical protein